MAAYEIEHYLSPGEHRDLYIDWLRRLRGRIDGRTGNGEHRMRSRPHDKAMAELYQNYPAFALEVINGILEEGDQVELLIVLRQMAQAFGGVQAVAEQAHLNPTQLYRTLSPKGNPALNSLLAIFKAMGLRLAVERIPVQSISDQRSAISREITQRQPCK